MAASAGSVRVWSGRTEEVVFLAEIYDDLPALKHVEILGPVYLVAAPVPHIQHARLTKQSFSTAGAILRKLACHPPTRLIAYPSMITDFCVFPSLETCPCASSEADSLASFRCRPWTSPATRLPLLTHLTTHIRILCQYSSSASTLPPTLTSIQVLPNPEPDLYRQLDPGLDDEAEGILLGVIRTLEKLESLIIPSCWRSEAVRELCEARGVKLVWTAES